MVLQFARCWGTGGGGGNDAVGKGIVESLLLLDLQEVTGVAT